MSHSRLALIIESDPNAVAQMRRVLAGMKMRAVAVSDEQSLHDAMSSLVRTDAPPALIVARVALPSGSGIRMLKETAERYPHAQQMLISHHPRNLLFSVPGFADHCVNFLKAEFTDDQFRVAVERALARSAAS
jgi:DNA-binding NtrC family response regulator